MRASDGFVDSRTQHESGQLRASSNTATALRRDLKTAGGVGLVNLESELLDKGIAYKGGNLDDSHEVPMLANPRSRIGKSTDANAFRRSLIISGGVLQQNASNNSLGEQRVKDDEVVIQEHI